MSAVEKREGRVVRKTKETDIFIKVNLDGKGNFKGNIGIGFFEHMLNLFASHALIDLNITAKGDLNVDAHHTVEDIGICLGKALKEAVGDKHGINRYGTSYIPMEESLAFVSLDFCNRPYLKYTADHSKEKVGDFEIELAEEFFRAVVMNAGITMHIKLLDGGNSHHEIEAIFKAFGKAFCQAVTKNPRIKTVLSTKGKL